MKSAVPRLHLIADRRGCAPRSLAWVAAAAARGGIGAVQLREKVLQTAELLPLACELRAALGATPLIVNCGGPDRDGAFAVARAVGAAGVHLPGDAGPLAAARAALGPGVLIGRSVHGLEEAREAAAEGADYLILGTIFATASKPGRDPAGLGLVAAVAGAVDVPIIAIGGVGEGNLAEVLRAGAWGAAVMSAVLAAPDPACAAERLRAIIESEGEGV